MAHSFPALCDGSKPSARHISPTYSSVTKLEAGARAGAWRHAQHGGPPADSSASRPGEEELNSIQLLRNAGPGMPCVCFAGLAAAMAGLVGRQEDRLTGREEDRLATLTALPYMSQGLHRRVLHS